MSRLRVMCKQCGGAGEVQYYKPGRHYYDDGLEHKPCEPCGGKGQVDGGLDDVAVEIVKRERADGNSLEFIAERLAGNYWPHSKHLERAAWLLEYRLSYHDIVKLHAEMVEACEVLLEEEEKGVAQQFAEAETNA